MKKPFFYLLTITFISTFTWQGSNELSAQVVGSEDYRVPLKMECIRRASEWKSWRVNETFEAPMPADFTDGVGTSCLVDYYDTNGNVTYHGAQPGSWNQQRTNCSQTSNDRGISFGRVTAEYCRVVYRNAHPYGVPQ